MNSPDTTSPLQRNSAQSTYAGHLLPNGDALAASVAPIEGPDRKAIDACTRRAEDRLTAMPGPTAHHTAPEDLADQDPAADQGTDPRVNEGLPLIRDLAVRLNETDSPADLARLLPDENL